MNILKQLLASWRYPQPLAIHLTVKNIPIRATASQLPPEIRRAMKNIVEYHFDEEAKDYMSLDGPPSSEHIFNSISIVRKWLHTK